MTDKELLDALRGPDVDFDYAANRIEELKAEIRGVRATLTKAEKAYRQEIEELKVENEMLKARIHALSDMMVCYRLWKRPTDKQLLAMDKTGEAMQQMYGSCRPELAPRCKTCGEKFHQVENITVCKCSTCFPKFDSQCKEMEDGRVSRTTGEDMAQVKEIEDEVQG